VKKNGTTFPVRQDGLGRFLFGIGAYHLIGRSGVRSS
jgi:hypothetical protein